jgi:hypothetical protein
MPASIQMTIVRPDTMTIWPWDIWDTQVNFNLSVIANGDVTLYSKGDFTNDLVLMGQFVFATKELREEYSKNIPMWVDSDNEAEAAEYLTFNNITLTLEYVDDPVLTDYELLYPL